MITYHNGITQPSHKECNSGFYLIHDPKRRRRFGLRCNLIAALYNHELKLAG
jgi:hypothetical protein